MLLDALGKKCRVVAVRKIALHFKKALLSRAYDWPCCSGPVFADFWR